MKIISLIKKIFDLDKRYNLTVMSASLSFYALISIISLFIIFVQILNYRYDMMDNLLINKLLSIFSNSFSDYLKEVIPKFTLNNYTSFSVVALFWSASCTVHSYNRIADNIYEEIQKRNSLKLRLSSLLMFLMLFVIVMFEIILFIYSKNLIAKYFEINNRFLIFIIEAFVDLFSIFLILLILYTYVPPIKMSFSGTYYGAIIITLILYIFINLYLKIINIYQKIGNAETVTFVFNSILIFVFSINYIIIFGIIINYSKNKNGKNKNNKKVNID